MKVGLTLGKYAPLHRGHQLVIETALAQVDHLIVLVYDASEVTDIPLATRATWIRHLYPQTEVIELPDGPTEVGNTPQITQMHDLYLCNLLKGRRITHFFSSEFYGEHVSRALNALDVRVDEARTVFPVSATAVRESTFKLKNFIHPLVYRDLITKVVLLGAPSTGKTTLAKASATMYDTVWMPEYGREYWELNQVNHRLSPEQLVEIAEGHILREDRLIMEANRYFFIDTDASTTFIFSLYYHGFALDRLHELASAARSRSDLFILCGEDIPYDDTPDRSGQASRKIMQEMIRTYLNDRAIPHTLIQGSLPSRVAQVKSLCAKYSGELYRVQQLSKI